MIIERLVGISARDKASAKAGNPGMTAYIGNATVDNSTTISDDKIFKSNSGSGADAGVSEAGGIVDGNVNGERIFLPCKCYSTKFCQRKKLEGLFSCYGS